LAHILGWDKRQVNEGNSGGLLLATGLTTNQMDPMPRKRIYQTDEISLRGFRGAVTRREARNSPACQRHPVRESFHLSAKSWNSPTLNRLLALIFHQDRFGESIAH
jgi:hypothetical protein